MKLLDKFLGNPVLYIFFGAVAGLGNILYFRESVAPVYFFYMN